MVEIDVEYVGDLRCRLKHGPSGADLITDAPTDNQGQGRAFSPTDLAAASLASCMMTTMAIYARRKEIELRGSRVRIKKEMVADPQRRIGRLEVMIDLPGGIEEAQRTALEHAAHTCPVERSLSSRVQVDVTFRYGQF